MYLSLLSFVVAVVTGIGFWLLDAGWLGGLLLGLVAFVACWIIGGRRIRNRLEPAMVQIQRQVEAGMLKPAIGTLESLLPIGNWVPLLKGQLYGQIGFLHHHLGAKAEALAALEKAGFRAGDAQLLLATLWYREGKKDDALARLAAAGPFNRKHVLLHNVHAWMLMRENRRDDAMAVLAKLLAKVPNDPTTDNLLRLKNDQKMNMKPFGMPWYALGFEHPPASMGEMRTARKGFRQAPKRRG